MTTAKPTTATDLDAWFAVRVAPGGLAIHFVFGTVAAIVFLAGWLWGVRNLPEPEEGKR
jgi:hypothetical protein